MNSMLWRPTLGGIDSKIEPKMLPILPHHTTPLSHVWICSLPLPQSYCNTRTTRTSTCGTRTSPLLSPRHTLPTHFSAHHDSRCHSSLLSLSFPPPTPSAARDSVHTHTYSQPHTVANLSSVSVALSLSHIVPSSGSLMLPKYMQAPKWLPTVQCTPLGTKASHSNEKMSPALLTVYPQMLQAKHPAARKLGRPVFFGVH